MNANVTLVVIAGVLIAAGVYLTLERLLTRILVGVVLISNGVNVLFLVAAGAAASPAFIGSTPAGTMSDPLPQAMVLTAIVITLGVTAFLLALAYRSFQLNGHDEVIDDVEDALIRDLAEADRVSESFDASDDPDDSTPDEEGLDFDRPEREPRPDDDHRDRTPESAEDVDS